MGTHHEKERHCAKSYDGAYKRTRLVKRRQKSWSRSDEHSISFKKEEGHVLVLECGNLVDTMVWQLDTQPLPLKRYKIRGTDKYLNKIFPDNVD